MAAVQQLELSLEVAAWANEGPGFTSHSVHLMDLFLANPLFNCSTVLVNSQLVCLLPIGLLIMLCLILTVSFLSFECC